MSYTFNNVNQMRAIADADGAGFSCTVTCEANNNITEIEEVQTDGIDTTTLIADFTYDWGNDFPGTPDTLEHVYAGARHIQNYDGSTYGEVWHWAGHESMLLPAQAQGNSTSGSCVKGYIREVTEGISGVRRSNGRWFDPRSGEGTCSMVRDSSLVPDRSKPVKKHSSSHRDQI